MTYSPLQWMGPEMVREGLFQNQDWVVDHSDKAVKLFANQGMHVAATVMAASSFHGFTYVEQCPALVLAAAQGSKLHRASERQQLARWWRAKIEDGPKLRDLMGAYGLAYPIRKLPGHALSPDKLKVVKALSKKVDPSTLAQSIPTKYVAGWLRATAVWMDSMRRYGDEAKLLDWAVIALSRSAPEESRMAGARLFDTASEVADFANARGQSFDTRWTWVQASVASAKWHSDIQKMRHEEAFFSRFGLRFDEAINYAPFPDETTVGDLIFVPLKSGQALFEEGQAMHHCVGTYSSAVIDGRSRIYGIRKGDRRLATLELNDRAEMVQIKAYCNAAPTPNVVNAAKAFVRAVFVASALDAAA